MTDKEKNLKPGQVIYVIFRKQGQLVPFRVVEEISRKTMQGNTVSYKVECGAQPGQIMDIAQLDGEIYTSYEAAQQMMLERATNAVTKMVNNALSKVREWYGINPEIAEKQVPSKINARHNASASHQLDELTRMTEEFGGYETELTSAGAEPIVVTLPDGTPARLKGPKVS